MVGGLPFEPLLPVLTEDSVVGALQPPNLMGEESQVRTGSKSPRPGDVVLGESVTARGPDSTGSLD